MNFTLNQVPGGPLQVAGALDIYSAEALRDALLRPVHSETGLVLDLSGVVSCDVIGLQLLYAARRSCEAYRRPFHVHSVSKPVCEAAAAVGLSAAEIFPGTPQPSEGGPA